MIGPVMDAVTAAVQAELQRAKADHGETYHSPHEAFGVLVEEWDEAIEEITAASSRMQEMPRLLRTPDEALRMAFRVMIDHAMYAAAELIQVAAVCEKAMETMYRRDTGRYFSRLMGL